MVISSMTFRKVTETMRYERRGEMRKTIVAGLLGVMMTVAAVKVAAQVAGSTTIGVPATEITTLTHGWSAKKQILGKTVYNDQNDKVGEVDDIIVAPDKSISYAIISVGGFLGMGEHNVVIPFNQLKADADKFVLRGATREALKALPTFEYAK
jgi:sporulation protein YlmC with PRC-barrel domain